MRTILTFIAGGVDRSLAVLDSAYFKLCLETFRAVRSLIDIAGLYRNDIHREMTDCVSCDEVYIFISELELMVNTCLPYLPDGDPDSPASLRRYLDKLVNNIHQYVAHTVRKTTREAR